MRTQPRQQRRLTRAQIQEILERNIALYRQEDHFESYLVELALYLLEYEYDWADAGVEPPACVQAAQQAQAVQEAPPAPSPTRAHTPIPEPPRATPIHTLTPSPSSLTPAPAAAQPAAQPAAPAPARAGSVPGRFISPKLQPAAAGRNVMAASRSGLAARRMASCPYCGTQIPDVAVCPACKNVVK